LQNCSIFNFSVNITFAGEITNLPFGLKKKAKMRMNFESICGVFPKDENFWPCPHPSSALPFFIRSYLRQHFGGIFAANDLYKKNAPSRLGVATRPFEIGDPISTISKNHFIKTQELLTRVDYGSGRQRVVVVFHSYPNMTYQSELSAINKGQLANGVTAVLEEAHKSLAHSFQMIKVTNPDLFEGCKLVGKQFQNADYAYFISDLLFDTSDTHAAANRVLEIIKFFHLKKAIFIIARDPMEYPSEEIEVEELVPWKQNKDSINPFYFSGNTYHKNIHNQISFFNHKMTGNNNLIRVVYPKETVSNFIDFILKDIFRKK
jgi:hypothetical protein